MVHAKRPLEMAPGESLLVGWDFTNLLASGETIVSGMAIEVIRASGGTPADPETDTAAVDAEADDITIGTPAANSAAFDNGDGGTCAIGKGVQAEISGPIAGGLYELEITATTSAGNDLVRRAFIEGSVE